MAILDVKFVQVMTAEKIQYEHSDAYFVVVY